MCPYSPDFPKTTQKEYSPEVGLLRVDLCCAWVDSDGHPRAPTLTVPMQVCAVVSAPRGMRRATREKELSCENAARPGLPPSAHATESIRSRTTLRFLLTHSDRSCVCGRLAGLALRFESEDRSLRSSGKTSYP